MCMCVYMCGYGYAAPDIAFTRLLVEYIFESDGAKCIQQTEMLQMEATHRQSRASPITTSAVCDILHIHTVHCVCVCVCMCVCASACVCDTFHMHTVHCVCVCVCVCLGCV